MGKCLEEAGGAVRSLTNINSLGSYEVFFVLISSETLGGMKGKRKGEDSLLGPVFFAAPASRCYCPNLRYRPR